MQPLLVSSVGLQWLYLAINLKEGKKGTLRLQQGDSALASTGSTGFSCFKRKGGYWYQNIRIRTRHEILSVIAVRGPPAARGCTEAALHQRRRAAVAPARMHGVQLPWAQGLKEGATSARCNTSAL